MAEIDREIPERERLVHDDPELAAQIREGIEQAEHGETRYLGSFAQYLEEDEDAPAINPEGLPPFSGPCPACPKCGLPRGKAVGTTVSYQRTADGREYVDRRCGHCGYGWPERCADADQAACTDCGGWNDSAIGDKCQPCVRYQSTGWRL